MLKKKKNSIATEFKNNEKIKLRGVREARERLTFSIENYNEDIDYFIEFGNGEKRKFRQSRLSYKYNFPGNFHIKIYATNDNGVKRSLYDLRLRIDDSIEVDSAAYRIDL